MSDGSAGRRFDEVCLWQNIRETCQNKLLLKREPLGVINSSGSSWSAIFYIKYFSILPCDILLCWKPKISSKLSILSRQIFLNVGSKFDLFSSFVVPFLHILYYLHMETLLWQEEFPLSLPGRLYLKRDEEEVGQSNKCLYTGTGRWDASKRWRNMMATSSWWRRLQDRKQYKKERSKGRRLCCLDKVFYSHLTRL